MKRKKQHQSVWKFSIVSLMLALLFLAGCNVQNPAGTTTLRLILDDSVASRSLLPDTTLEVSYYTITGSGPNDGIFNVSSNDAAVTVPGLEVGSWEITAYGWNETGVRLISGSTAFELSPSNQEASITLDQYSGTGTLSILISWDDTLTYNPEFHMYLYSEGSAETEVTPTLAAGSASYETELNAGSYILRCELLSDGEPVAGCVEAVRIVDSLVSGGTITLDLNTLESSLSLSLTDKSVSPVSGTITGQPDNPIVGSPFTLTFSPTNVDESDIGNLVTSWYLDGIYQGSGDTCAISPNAGTHRVDTLSQTADSGSSGSASLIFNVDEPGVTGSLTLAGTLEDNVDNYRLDGVEFIKVAPDGLIITTSKVDDCIQTFRMESGMPVLKQTILDDGTIPLNGVKEIAVSDDGSLVCAITDYAKSLVIFSHVPGTDTLQFVEAFDTSFTFGGSSVNIGLLSGIVIDHVGGNIYMVDRFENRFYHFYYSGTEVVPIDYYLFVTNPVMDSPRKMAISPDCSRIAVPCHGSSILMVLSIDPVTGVLSLETILSYLVTGTIGLGGANYVRFIDNETLLLTSSVYLCEFSYGPPSPGESETWYQTQRLSEGTEVPVMDGPKHVGFNSDKSCVYVSTSISNGITVFRRNTENGILSYDGFIELDPGDPSMTALTSDGMQLLAPSSVSDQIFVFDIAQ